MLCFLLARVPSKVHGRMRHPWQKRILLTMRIKHLLLTVNSLWIIKRA